MKVPLLIVLLFCICCINADRAIGRLEIATTSKSLRATFRGHNRPLQIELGIRKEDSAELQNNQNGSQGNTVLYTRATESVRITQKTQTGEDVECHTITWINPDSTLEDCITLGDVSWYGGGELFEQHWPISNLSHPRSPYITGDFYHHPYGGLISRFWFNADGYSCAVDPDTPLFLRFNNTGDQKMCFSASTEEYPYINSNIGRAKRLKYTICSAPNVRKVFEYSWSQRTKRLRELVDTEVLLKPIWSTWAKYKADINQDIVLDFAKAISDRGFEGSHLEIDDKWETCYGDLEFDSNKFPDPAGTVQKIKAMGFNVSIWIHPFTNLDCATFAEGASKGYFVKNITSGQPLKTTWWNGDGGYLDTTNPEAVQSIVNRLKSLQDRFGIDSFKFDAGELHWMQPEFLFHNPEAMKRPNDFSTHYTEMASRFGKGVEVRVAYDSQNLPIFFRMLDKDSVWGYNNGLKSLIPVALLFSVSGYPFILPDMIGGNNYNSATPLPDKELYIRWLQLNTFLPVLQFSLLPWDYDEATSNLTQRYIQLHQKYVPLMISLGGEAIRTGNPVIRPLWWTDPINQNSLMVDSEFLVGDDLLVAPVVEPGARSRDIYLPTGNWKGMIDGGVHNGPNWIRNYEVPLEELPYFLRQN